MRPFKVLAIDQSLTAMAAVSLLEAEPGKLRLTDQRVCRSKSTGIHRLGDLRQAFNNWIQDRHSIWVREMHNMRQFGAASALHSLSGIIDLMALDQGMLDGDKYAIISPSTWKKFITGKGTLKKDTAYLMTLNRHLRAHPMLETDEAFEVDDDNVADAICMGVTAYACLKVKLEQRLPVTETVRKQLKGVLDKMFDHGSAAN